MLAELGDAEAAVPHIQQARESGGERYGRQAAVLAADRADGILALRAGRAVDARELLERARQRAEQLGQPYELARTLVLLAEAHDAAGNAFACGTPSWSGPQELLEGLGAAPITWSFSEDVGATAPGLTGSSSSGTPTIGTRASSSGRRARTSGST